MSATVLATLLVLSAPAPVELRGKALLTELERRAVVFFWQESHPETGFTKDRARNLEDKDDFTVSSCAATGFALAAYPIGVERGWLKRPEALARTRLTVRSLYEKHDQFKGWFAHFIDWRTGKRVWNSEFSTIDTSILLGGLLAAERYWKDPEVTRWTGRIVRRIDWEAMRTQGGAKPESKLVFHGYRPEGGGYLNNTWGGGGYSEEKMLVLQALGFDPKFPTDGWEAIVRKEFDFAGLRFLTGGPIFIHQMSESFYDFKNRRDRMGYDYWVATRNAILANRAYCVQNPKGFKAYGPDFWGLSACDGPDGYSAFGAPIWVEDNGTINPSSGIAGIPHTPQESLALAENLYAHYGYAWGRYGFSNGLNPHRDWVTKDVIGIELGMMLLALDAAGPGLIHRLNMSHPAIRRGFQRAGFRPSLSDAKTPLRS